MPRKIDENVDCFIRPSVKFEKIPKLKGHVGQSSIADNYGDYCVFNENLKFYNIA